MIHRTPCRIAQRGDDGAQRIQPYGGDARALRIAAPILNSTALQSADIESASGGVFDHPIGQPIARIAGLRHALFV